MTFEENFSTSTPPYSLYTQAFISEGTVVEPTAVSVADLEEELAQTRKQGFVLDSEFLREKGEFLEVLVAGGMNVERGSEGFDEQEPESGGRSRRVAEELSRASIIVTLV